MAGPDPIHGRGYRRCQKGASASIVGSCNGNNGGDSFSETSTASETHLLHLEHQQKPLALAKARKNTVEHANIHACHVRHEVALCLFLAMLDRTIVFQYDDGEKSTKRLITNTATR